MSLVRVKKNSDKELIPIARDSDGYTIFYDENGTSPTEIKSSGIEPIPIIQKNQIVSTYIAGMSGSGKSTFAAQWAHKIYKAQKPKIKNIFLFTFNSAEDEAFDKLRAITTKYTKLEKYKLVEVEESIFVTLDATNLDLYEQPMEVFRDSIIICDDYAESCPPKLEKVVDSFILKLISNTRKLNISPIIIRHKMCLNKATANIILECQYVWMAPRFNMRDVSSFLKNYMNFTPDEIQEIRKMKGRGIVMRKSIPQFIVSENIVQLI